MIENLANAALLAFATIAIFFFIKASFSFAPWIPSSVALAREGLKKINASASMRFADLGCGDGRIVALASRQFGMNAVGYEISLIPYLLARLRQALPQKKSFRIEWKDLFEVPLENFDVLYIYGLPRSIAERLVPKLEREVSPGTFVLSYNFKIVNKPPIGVIHDRWRNLYIYRY